MISMQIFKKLLLNEEINMKYFYLLIVIILITGCKPKIIFDIYYSDLISEEGSVIIAEVISKFSGEKQCNENSDRVSKVMQKYFEEVENKGCNKEFINLAVDVPVSNKIESVPFTFLIENNSLYGMKDDKLWSAMEKDLKQINSLANTEIENAEFKIINDSKKSINVKVSGVWVDNQAVVWSQDFKIKRKKSITLRAGSVMLNSVNKGKVKLLEF